MKIERIERITEVQNNLSYHSGERETKREEDKLSKTPAAILSISDKGREANKNTHIYCMAFSNDWVKIGISNDIKRRIRELNGSEIVKRYWYSVPLDRGEAMFLEKLIHSYLRETWEGGVESRGEYFDMDLEEAIKVVRTFTEGRGSEIIEY